MKTRPLFALAALASPVIWLAICPAGDDRSSLTIRGGPGAIRALAFGPGGRSLASTSADREVVKVWALPAGTEVRTLPTAGVASDLAFSRPGGPIAWGSGWGGKGVLESWDPSGRRQADRGPPAGRQSQLTYSPEADRFAVVTLTGGGRSSEVVASDAAGGAERLRVKLAASPITPPALSPDGRCLALGTANLNDMAAGMTIRVWDLIAGKERALIPIRWADRLAFSPDNRTLAGWSEDEAMTIELWDIDARRPLRTLRAPDRAMMNDVTFSPDGSLLASAAGKDMATMIPLVRSVDGEVRVWRVATGEEVATLRLDRPATRVAFAPDGQALAAGCDDGTIKVWGAPAWLTPGHADRPHP